MATEDQFIAARRAAGVTGATTARVRCNQPVTFTVAGNTTVKVPVNLPAGAYFRGIQVETPADVGGTPTTCNFRCGTADTGQQVVADVDVKAQGHFSTTIVTGLDKVGGFSAAQTTLYLQLTTAGGTSPTGTVYAFVDYDAPTF
jgi:hypothetical protein